jgi:hypothetical protein
MMHLQTKEGLGFGSRRVLPEPSEGAGLCRLLDPRLLAQLCLTIIFCILSHTVCGTPLHQGTHMRPSISVLP